MGERVRGAERSTETREGSLVVDGAGADPAAVNDAAQWARLQQEYVAVRSELQSAPSAAHRSELIERLRGSRAAIDELDLQRAEAAERALADRGSEDELAAALAASHPACPPPMTMTSYLILSVSTLRKTSPSASN